MIGYRTQLLIAFAAAVLAAGAACSGSEEKAAPAANVTSSATGTAAPAEPAGTATRTATAAVTSSVAASTPVAVSGAPAITRLNLNTATPEQFKTIPNVGDRFVREFNEYRPYSSILQFRRELGKYVNQDQVRQWEQYLYVPVDPNQSDAATLQQIPGVTEAVAQQLISARPYASTDAFIAKLASVIPSAQAEAARSFLAPR